MSTRLRHTTFCATVLRNGSLSQALGKKPNALKGFVLTNSGSACSFVLVSENRGCVGMGWKGVRVFIVFMLPSLGLVSCGNRGIIGAPLRYIWGHYKAFLFDLGLRDDEWLPVCSLSTSDSCNNLDQFQLLSSVKMNIGSEHGFI